MKKSTVRKFVSSKLFTLLLLLIIVFITFTVISNGAFIKPRNIRNIFNGMVITLILTAGAGYLLISGQIDLSTGAIGTMSGVIFAKFIEMGAIWPIALIIAFVFAAVAGFINAFFINRFRLQGFIVTMAVASALTGLTYVATGGLSVPIRNVFIEYIGTKMIWNIVPISTLLAAFVFVVYAIILAKTSFGMQVYLIGGNPTAARLAGLNPTRVSYVLFINNALLGALAGCLLTARMKSATTTGIAGSQFAGITAAILGGVSFGGGSGSLFGAFVGLLVINAFNNGMSVVGINTYWQSFASGTLLLVALTFDYINVKRSLVRKG